MRWPHCPQHADYCIGAEGLFPFAAGLYGFVDRSQIPNADIHFHPSGSPSSVFYYHPSCNLWRAGIEPVCTRVDTNLTAGQGHVCLTSVIKWELVKHSSHLTSPHTYIYLLKYIFLKLFVEIFKNITSQDVFLTDFKILWDHNFY